MDFADRWAPLGQSLEPVPMPRRDPRSPPPDMMGPPPRRLTPEELAMLLRSAIGELDRDLSIKPYTGPIYGDGNRMRQGRY